MKGSVALIPGAAEAAREDLRSTADNLSMDWGKGTCRNDDFSWAWFCECKRVSLLQRERTKAFQADVSHCLLLILKVSSKNVSSRAKNVVPGSLVTVDAWGGWRCSMNRASASLHTGKRECRPKRPPRTPRRPPGSHKAQPPRLFPVWAASRPTVPVFEKMSCRMRGRRVTIPEPRGRKSLWEGKWTEITHEAGWQGAGRVTIHGGAMPSCNLRDFSKDINPSRAPGNAPALEGPEAMEGQGRDWTEGW